MNQCFLLLGTNIGDKAHNLLQAREYIIERIGEIIKPSAIYQTSAWGKEDQDDFYNQVLCIQTALSPMDLLVECLAIEKDLGRIRFERWGERLIDIDILYFENEVIETEDLKVPHPELQNRRFTLIPLVELAPDYTHPKMNQTNKHLLACCTDPLEVVKIN
ncbi:2-amino-4-hydroxy-6-hydroxymethyldihydropteridine diphosphokinase [Reichenbachiella carrageenanivorans]|uniref:2-amino-4-hydroxy-6-hydroxymethyldihydropteridine pyrophosphokinase n=1 Tax=Reichenbachiella carrageenanivorans TaxID=2979869 RepID=A0ABY6CWN7_9BACT|nr:2-amino-4-hydroxy-6-hydroxymethyldihydropteridine diphosphokinase [Reichenbachiella carrageenanivorans]UXX78341.1 2-amino-4-hydroxy-6-hydroxymethyldihydropteridine diphosphokinase [Reichenbachiella carrageenanivorans]